MQLLSGLQLPLRACRLVHSQYLDCGVAVHILGAVM